MISTSLNSALNPNVVKKSDLDEVFMAEFERTPGPGHATAEDAMVFNQSTSDDAAHVAEIFGGISAWDIRANDEAQMQSEAPRAGDKITFEMLEFSKEMPISKRFFDDDQYDVVSKGLIDFANKARVARDKNAFGLFRNGFTTTLTADGVALFSNSHVTLSGDSVDNLLTDALSDTALNDAIVALLEQKDQAGEVVGHEAACLLVPPALFKKACEITDSELRSGTADNDVNVYSTKYGIEVRQSQYLGAAAGGLDAGWFLLGRNHSAYRWVRQGIETAMTGWEYSKNNSYVYKGMFREAVGALTYEGMVGSNGTT